jgi:hypothetical protein
MHQTFCFHCEAFVDVLDNNELSCGHTVADQQTMYEFLIDKVDKVLRKVYAEHNIQVADREIRKTAFDTTMDFLGKWYSDHFQPW